MKLKTTILFLLVAFIGYGQISSARKLLLLGETTATLPTVTTTSVTGIDEIDAISGGNVTSDGGATVTARGVCWSTSPSPTISNEKTSDGTGTGVFTSNIIAQALNTTYYVRAYATNSVGTSYGNEVSFTTTNPTLYLNIVMHTMRNQGDTETITITSEATAIAACDSMRYSNWIWTQGYGFYMTSTTMAVGDYIYNAQGNMYSTSNVWGIYEQGASWYIVKGAINPSVIDTLYLCD